MRSCYTIKILGKESAGPAVVLLGLLKFSRGLLEFLWVYLEKFF